MIYATWRDRFRDSLRQELAAIDYAIRIKTEDIARYSERRAKIHAQLTQLEGNDDHNYEK